MVALAKEYNNAFLLWERNNHGHAVETWLKMYRDTGKRVRLIYGYDSTKSLSKLGWPSNNKSKALAAEETARILRAGGITIHDEISAIQLQSIEAETLLAPEGEHDDLADNITVVLGALRYCRWPVWDTAFTN